MKGKWIVVTGASDGIGSELCLLLIKNGNKVILVGRNEGKLKKVCEEARKYNGECFFVIYDFMQEFKGNFLEGYEVGMLINNAGCSSAHPCYVYEDDLKPILKVNAYAPFFITQEILKRMCEKRFGYVINIGSILSEFSTPLLSTYSATKAMIKSWSSSLSYEMQPFGIIVECVMPGLVCTKMSKIKKKSFFVPDARTFAECLLNTCGTNKVTVPYLPHLTICIVLSLIPNLIKCTLFHLYTSKIREIAIKKKVK